MKKNISINISGIIFHIEEDAYEQLRDYLDAINRYFSNFDGSQEIIADIESRIAELFLAKLNEEKQIITAEDVTSLISTMGSIKDFQAIEEPDIPEDNGTGAADAASDSSWSETGSKTMYRDEKRKLLGGVCAGMAHYFNIDPLWIRLIAIILVLASYGILVVVYIILWIVLPVNYDLTEDKKLKKMYRDPEGKVIAGVSSGVAAYFAVDVAVIRLLFVIFTFVGGAGLLAYIILWIILPEAKGVTDRVQMQGDPVTLSNIESNIKKGLSTKEGEENLFVKILLFPFRLIAVILSGLGKALGPLMLFFVEFLRIVAGVLFVLIGLALAFSMITALGIFLGLFSTDFWLADQPFMMLSAESFPVFTAVAAFFLILIPGIFLILLGASVIAKRIIFNATAGWSLFAIFILSCIVLSANVPRIIYNFREEGHHQVTQTFDLADKTAVLKLRETGMEDYEVAELTLRGHEGTEYELVQLFESHGSTRKNAIENAQMITYNVDFNDSIFTFDSNIAFKDGSIFRAQELDMTLYIPYNKPFMMDEDLKHIIRNTIYRNGYRVSDMEGNIWIFTAEEQLKCTTCPEREEDDEEDVTGFNENGDYDREYTFNKFEAIEVESALTVNIVKSETYKVGVEGRSNYLDDLEIYVDADKLFIDYKDGRSFDGSGFTRNDLEITIFAPLVTEIDLTGASKLYMNDFRQRNMSISLTGASFAKLSDVYFDDLDIKLTGASELEIQGSGTNMDADLSGASHLEAYDYEAVNATVEAHGASSAKVYVTNELTLDEKFASDVKYRGDARVSR